MNQEWRRANLRMETLISSRLGHSTSYVKNSAIILDLSLSGVRIETQEPLELKQRVVMTFSVRNKFSFENVVGEVAWVKKTNRSYSVGIIFVERPDSYRLLEAMSSMIAPDLQA